MLIYAIRTVNNKCYIGQAQHSLEQRWKKHVNDAKRGSNFPFTEPSASMVRISSSAW